MQDASVRVRPVSALGLRRGFGGQGLYIIAPELDLIIAWFGTQDERGGTEMLTLARQLATSGIF